MKYILFILMLASTVHAGEYIVYETATGNVIAHGSTFSQNSEKIVCGDLTLKGYNASKISTGNVAAWIEGATNISELGTVTETARAEQDAKPAAKKARELKFKTLVTDIGFTVPIQEGQLDTMLEDLNSQVATLLDENKTKEAVAIQAKVISVISLWIKLGDDIYATHLGE
jgi:hypothetical protein